MFDSFSRSFGSTMPHLAEGEDLNMPERPVDPFFGAVASYQICGCCGNFHSVVDGSDGGGQGVILNADDRGMFGPNGKPSLDPIDAGAQITRNNWSWATGLGQPAVVTFAFRDTFVSTLPDGTSGHNAFSAAQISATLLALAAWSDVANITFQRVNDGATQYSENATILFGNYTSGQSGAAAFAYLPGGMPGATAAGAVQGDVWINSSLSYNANPVMQAYGQQVLLHEIGHAIGLSHPAAYNASANGTITYGANAIYFEDSRQYTVMSYFSEANTGGNFGGRYSAVPLLDDIAAAQRLYGANTTTRTGDTVYGFNSNAGQPWFTATSAASALIFAVWDAGGNDTFDFSGYSVAQTIDLRQGAFSSVGGLTGNIAIAVGAVIENVIGGTGADTIRGNSANNVITSNGGNDQIDGGLGIDTVVFSGARANYTVTWNGQVGTITGLGQTVTVSNVEFLQFSDQTIAAAPTGGLLVGGDITNETITGTAFGDTIGGLGGNDVIHGLAGDDTLDGGSGDDVLNGGDGNDILIGGRGNDALNGGAGHDVADYTDATAGVTVNLVAGTASGGAGSDTLTSIEEVRGSAHADTITGDANANILRGGGGIDTLNGGGGDDQLFAGAPGEGGGAPDIVKTSGMANNSIANAVSLAGGFDLGTRADVANSTTIPHATVVATSHGGMEYYAVTVVAGDTVVFDIDNASFDSVLRIFDSSHTQLAQNDDNAADGGPATDSGLSHTFAAGGTYYIQVSQWQSGADATLVTSPPPAGGTYTLHVSVPSAPVVPLEYLGATMNGEDGADILTGGSGRDTLNGGAGDDVLNGGGDNDTIDGGAGTDTAVFSGNRSAYTISTTSGVTTVTGPDGTDTLTNVERLQFANGLFDITGAPLNPSIDGTSGPDNIVGTADDDTINGLDGDDVITGGLGNDTIDGGAGVDTAVFSGTMAQSTVTTVGAVTTVTGPDGTDTLTNVERLRFSDGTLIVGANGGQYFAGTANADTITGTAFNDQIEAGAGDDTITGGAGADTIDGGAGTDTAVFSGNRSAYTINTVGAVTTVSGPDGADSLTNVERLQFADGLYLITGAPVVNTINGTAGPDMLVGTTGIDSISGGDGDDTLYGLGGSDVLFGGPGNDLLDGGSGADQMSGGSGHDAYYVDDAGDVLTEEAGAGRDIAYVSANYALAAQSYVETLIAVSGAGPISLTGNALGNELIGNAHDNVLNGGDGNDLLSGDDGNDNLIGGTGRDTLIGGQGNDVLDGGAGTDTAVFSAPRLAYTVSRSGDVTTVVGPDGTDTLVNIERLQFADGVYDPWGNALSGGVNGSAASEQLIGDAGPNTINGFAGNDVLLGLSGDDDLFGGDGNDYLDGGAGVDQMAGGAGDDIYIIDDAEDVIIEESEGGTDIARTSVSYVLAETARVETLVAISGAGPLSLTGNSLNNELIGNAHDNVLSGGDGNDNLFGDDGNDLLIGGIGNDALFGGLGSDVYIVDGGDAVFENVGGGVDRILAVESFALGSGQEVEYLELFDQTSTAHIELSGNEFNNTLIGGAGVNILRGGAGADTLQGMAGDDFLDGGEGADVMYGGVGNDTYYVDDASDLVVELSGEGFDRIATSVSLALRSDQSIEVFEVLNSTSTGNISLIGNAFDQVIAGNFGDNYIFGDDGNDVLAGYAGDDILDGGAGNDVLIGGAGVDQMTGGAGNDKFFVDNENDVVLEAANGGTDTVASSVSFRLTAGSHIENLEPITFGSTVALNFTGNELSNRILGNNGDNIINGGAGSDVLEGLGGADQFVFADALGANNIDTISDFTSGQDKIVLVSGIFNNIAPGVLVAGAFVTGSQALDADDRIIYDRSTGALWFDSDGSGAAAAIQFAVVLPGLDLAASDFLIVDVSPSNASEGTGQLFGVNNERDGYLPAAISDTKRPDPEVDGSDQSAKNPASFDPIVCGSDTAFVNFHTNVAQNLGEEFFPILDHGTGYSVSFEEGEVERVAFDAPSEFGGGGDPVWMLTTLPSPSLPVESEKQLLGPSITPDPWA